MMRRVPSIIEIWFFEFIFLMALGLGLGRLLDGIGVGVVTHRELAAIGEQERRRSQDGADASAPAGG